MTTERDVMEYDVVIVGAGPAGLACAIRLRQLKPGPQRLRARERPRASALTRCPARSSSRGRSTNCCRTGAQSPPAICVPASAMSSTCLHRSGAWRLPTPPQLNNHGNFIVSLGQLVAWLGAAGRERSASMCSPASPPPNRCSTRPARSLACSIGDMGLRPATAPGPNFTPGAEMRAPLTVLAEGCRGSLTKQLIARFGLDADRSPQTYGLGFKELWQLPAGRTRPGLISTRWAGRSTTAPTAAASSTTWTATACTSASSSASTTTTRAAAVRGLPAASRTTRSSSPLLEGGELAGLRRAHHRRRRLAVDPAALEMPGALLVGDAGGMLNFAQDQGRAPGDPLRRCSPPSTSCAPAAAPDSMPRWRASAGGARAAQGAQHQARLQARSVVRSRQRRLRDGDRRAHSLDAAATTPTMPRCERLDCHVARPALRPSARCRRATARRRVLRAAPRTTSTSRCI